MSSNSAIQEARRSTRIRLKVVIESREIAGPFICEGETLVVNLHGALIITAIPLRVGARIEIHVILPNERATATVVYVDPDQPRHSGVSLDLPKNVWGVPVPPEDWLKQN